MKRNKAATAALTIAIAGLCSFRAWAGNINGNESAAVSVMTGTFEGQGKTYRAKQSYINEAMAYLRQDDVDMMETVAADEGKEAVNPDILNTEVSAAPSLYQLFLWTGLGICGLFVMAVTGLRHKKITRQVLQIKNRIDLHCHLLPEVDDGPRSLEESVEMLKQANRQGIQTIIATAHFTPGKRSRYSGDQLIELGRTLQAEAEKINPEFKIFVGNEIYYTEAAAEGIKQGKALTLAGSRYILVEFSPSDSYGKIYAGLRKLTASGYLVILAHFERYEKLFGDPERVRELLQMGIFLQMNLRSLAKPIPDSKTRRCRRYILDRYVHFLATDCHRAGERPGEIAALRWLAGRCTPEYAEKLLWGNARYILEDKIL